MTGSALQISTEDAGFQEAFERLNMFWDSLDEPLEEIGNVLLTSTDVRFETETAPDGTDWEQSLRAANQNGQTLTNYGHLRNSLTFDAGTDFVMIGTNLVYAGIHQFGGQTGRGLKVTMPERAFLGLSEDDKTEIHDVLNDFAGRTFAP